VEKAKPQLVSTGFVLLLLVAGAATANPEMVLQLLDKKSCSGCKLEQADLVYGQLQGANLKKAKLRGANLGRADLSAADLRGADLRDASLQGANLHRADLRGAKLEGTDLRSADLTDAKLDIDQLASSYIQGAKGIPSGARSYAELHNAGVKEALAGKHPEAEQHFAEAIAKKPNAAISWMARGISRQEQGRSGEAANDLAYAARLYHEAGDVQLAKQLKAASLALSKGPAKVNGNGWGSQLLSGAWSIMQQLAPLALKMMGPSF
jgi:uncharacterized protein YjbI with pentapeptide repeats